MHTLAILSDVLGATYETLPGQFHQVNNLFRGRDRYRPIPHLVAGWVARYVRTAPALSRLGGGPAADRRTSKTLAGRSRESQISSRRHSEPP